MHTHDRIVRTPLVFHVALIAALVTGIGCDGSSTSKSTGFKDAGSLDVGKDMAGSDGARNPDVATPDLARGDLALTIDLPLDTDTSKVDAPPISPDTRPQDGAVAEVPPQLDVPTGTDTRIDAASVDGDPNDASDALSGSDALSTTQARVTFAFKNTGTQVVYLQMQCWLTFQVMSEETSTVYPNTSICLCQCADPLCQELPHCAPCAPRSGIAVEPGKTYSATWTAQANTTKDKTGTQGTFKCIEYAPIPVGAYRVSIPVFPTAADAAANTNPASAGVSFQLSSASATIEVPIR